MARSGSSARFRGGGIDEDRGLLDVGGVDPVTLRAAVTADTDAVAGLFAASRLAAMPYLPILYTPPEVRWWIENVVLKQTCVTLATSTSDQVLGFCSVREQSLEHLYVAPDAQRLGVGTLLLKTAQHHAPGGLRLHVFQRNTKAREFYEKHGFRLASLRDGSQNEEQEPDAVYVWP